MKLSEMRAQIDLWLKFTECYGHDDPEILISDSGIFKETHSIIASPNGDKIFIIQDNKPSVETCKCHCHVEDRTGIKCRCIKNCLHCRPERLIDGEG